jgi:hypothetical protein
MAPARRASEIKAAQASREQLRCELGEVKNATMALFTKLTASQESDRCRT